MPTIAVIDDDQATCELFEGWLREFDPAYDIRRFLTRSAAEAAIPRERFDLVLLDIKLGADRFAGVGLIHLIGKHQRCPVIVISGEPEDINRGVMKELDAYEYLPKPVIRDTLVQTVKHAIRRAPVAGEPPPVPAMTDTLPRGLELDPLGLGAPRWKGQRLQISITQQRILFQLAKRRNEKVTYRMLAQAQPTATSEGSVQTAMVKIRGAFEAIDPGFDKIRNIPLLGYMWTDD
jgi:DNA-binding response OmpR family regulator